MVQDTTLESKNPVSELEAQILILRSEKAELKKNLNQAAVYGKQLVEQNSLLTQQLTDCQKKQETQIEKYEQECHGLRQDLGSSQKLEKVLKEELKNITVDFRNMQDQLSSSNLKQDELRKSNEVLHLRVKKMESEIQQLHKDNENLLAERELAKGHLAEARKAHDRSLGLDASRDDTDSFFSLQVECEEERSKRMKCETEILELKTIVKNLQSLSCSLTEELKTAQDLLKDKQKEIFSVGSLLEEVREENVGLQALLDAERLASGDPQQRGNSLFGEVEDRRQRAEVELKMYEDKYQNVKKQLSVLQQDHALLKARYCALLSTVSSSDNTDYIRDLEERLATTAAELRDKVVKVNDLESQLQNSGLTFGPQDPSKQGQIQYISDRALEGLLKQARGEIAKLTGELHTHRLNILCKDEDVRSLNRELRRFKELANRKVADCVALKQKVDELESKLKGPDADSKKIAPRFVKEQIPLDEAPQVSEPVIQIRERVVGKENVPPPPAPSAEKPAVDPPPSYLKHSLTQKKTVRIVEDEVPAEPKRPAEPKLRPSEVEIIRVSDAEVDPVWKNPQSPWESVVFCIF